MIVVTTECIADKKVTRTLGVVKGNTVRACHLGEDIMAFVKNLVGGELREYTEVIAQAREQHGMQTFEQHLAQLVESGAITVDAASATAADPAAFELQLKSLKKKSRSQRETQPV